MRKSIWIISKYASPPHSRGGQRGISLAKEFARAGHQAAVVASSSNHFGSFKKDQWHCIERGFKKAHFDGVTMLAHSTFLYRHTASLERIVSWLHFEWGLFRLPTRHLANPTHIIVSSLSLLSIVNGYRFARKFGAKLIFEIRDIWPLTLQTESNVSPKNLFVALLSAIEIFGYRKSDLIVGTMPNLAAHVQSVAGTAPRVETIPQGIDEDLLQIVPRYFPAPRGNTPRIVGYAGSIGRGNAVDVLLDAALKIGGNHNLEFHFWGGGELLDHYRERYGRHAYISFHGPLPRDVLLREVRKAHLLFFATSDSLRWSYGQSLNKVIEYMVIGRPIIASYSGYRSMLDEAECGIYVPAGDSQSLAQTLITFGSLPSKELERLGRNGRKWVLSERSYATLASGYLHLLDAL